MAVAGGVEAAAGLPPPKVGLLLTRGVSGQRGRPLLSLGVRERDGPADLWEWAQNRRALFIGRFVLPSYLRDPGLLANTRRRVAESGNEVHVELWSDEDLEADYTPAELGR